MLGDPVAAPGNVDHVRSNIGGADLIRSFDRGVIFRPRCGDEAAEMGAAGAGIGEAFSARLERHFVGGDQEQGQQQAQRKLSA